MELTLVWGFFAGLVHFITIGILYGNPIIDRIYATAMSTQPAVRKWESKGKYLLTQFLGTQIEVYILAGAYFLLRTFADQNSILFCTLLAAVRVYPRFWNMWIQSTYPRNLLAVEFINGTIGTFVIIYFLRTFAP